MKKTKWAVIGSGRIAGRFLHDLALLPDAQVTGITGRSRAKTEALASAHGATAHDSTASLLASGADVVYVATPNHLHYADTLACLEAGKAVVCEKPFTLNRAQASGLVELARKKHLFLMEGMWTRFFPAVTQSLALLESGALGELVTVEAQFGYEAAFAPDARAFDPELGGGSLLDVGVYGLALAQMCFGWRPAQITSRATMAATGVDGAAAWTLDYGGGKKASGSSSVTQTLSNDAVITGSKGTIHLPRFWRPDEFIYQGVTRRQEYPGTGFQFEARHVMECLREGRSESPLWPLASSLDLMQTMDEMRAQWGLSYPAERRSAAR